MRQRSPRTTTARSTHESAPLRPGTPASPPGALGAVPEPLSSITGFLVNRLAERLREATVAQLRDPRVQLRQVGLLLLLREHGPSQQQALGERLGMDRTTTMQLVARLEQDGLVVRHPDPADGRAYLVQLTPEGGRVAQQVQTDALRAQRQVLSPLSTAEAATLHRLLLTLLDQS